MKRIWIGTLVALALGASGCAGFLDDIREHPDYSPGAVTSGFNDEYREWIVRAAEQCDAVTPELLAAQIEAESSFRSDALSNRGAMGPSQFIPETWATWGVDADGDGIANPYSIPDAVTAQAAFMCENIRLSHAGVAAGSLEGDPLNLALAAYNAGFGAVQRFGGMPEGGEYSSQTQPYVQKILDRKEHYRELL
ncbi:lytic transglycosylase domain-containing protein [Hoyosella rhizosphaerae]|nr:lytic transglycosylase domain-containing protein [Hoyosella rhizosphaerae]